jgi:hypothetical protein
VRRDGHLLTALRQPGFGRLLAVRLSGQVGDGIFQASLAGTVLFNPERQAHAADVAAGFAVLLLPYSFIGPFAGVLIDRWWRQRILLVVNVLRALGVCVVAAGIQGGLHGQPFYASALVIVSLSRFLLSALSASLPHVVGEDELPTANALSTTLGAIATTAGGAVAILANALTGSSQKADAVTAACAAVPYLLGGLIAYGFARQALGPDDVERGNRETLGAVARGMVAGAEHIYECKPVYYALTAIGVHRLCYGVSTVCTLLLYRNYFHDDGLFRAGLPGLAQLVAMVAVGGTVAALVTPVAIRRLGFGRWPALLLGCAAAVQILVLPYLVPLVLVAALLLGFASQGIKISVDTLIQEQMADEFRGRVFAFYDTLFNIALVVAAVLTALVLPDNGHSPASVLVIASIYLVNAVVYDRATRRLEQAPPAHLAERLG